MKARLNFGFLLTFLLSTVASSSCGFLNSKFGTRSSERKGESKTKSSENPSGEASESTQTWTAGSTSTQKLSAKVGVGEVLAEASIAPGSLAIDTEVKLGEGAPLNNSEIYQALDLDEKAELSAGASIAVMSSNDVELSKPMTLRLPAPASATALVNDSSFIIVLFHAKDPATGKSILGTIPSSEVTKTGDQIEISVKMFGVYQAVRVQNEVKSTKKVEVSFAPSLTRKEYSSVEKSETLTQAAQAQAVKDEIPPIPANNLRWEQSSPSSSTALTALWDKSKSIDLAGQKIQFYTGASCSSAFGDEVDLGAASLQTKSFSASFGQSFTFKIKSSDASGNSSASDCSSEISVQVNPAFRALSLASVVSDGYLNAAERSSSAALTGTLDADYETVEYAIASAAATCSTVTGYSATLPAANSGAIAAEGDYKICVRVSPGNIYGQSSNFKLDVTAPSFDGLQSILPRTSGTSAFLFWNIPADNISKSYDIAYDICVATEASGSCQSSFEATTTRAAGNYDTEIGSLSSGVNYQVIVRARDQAGNRDSNTRTMTTMGLSGVTQIAAGSNHTCALMDDDTVKCWGSNVAGQLGDGTTTDRYSPVSVAGLSGVASIAVGKSHVSSGTHSCAVLSDSTVKCWGNNGSNQLGDGTSTNTRLNPVSVTGLSGVSKVQLGEIHSCALLTNQTVKCWGYGGVIGDGTSSYRSLPTLVSGLSGVQMIATGMRHTCAVLSDGTVKCWGYNTYGQLGDGTTNLALSPVIVSGLSSATAVALGGDHSCVTVSGGSIKCWGDGAKLGDGAGIDRTAPVDVQNVSSVSSISAGVDHTCAVLTSGTVKCWGTNSDGELGNGTAGNGLVPVEVLGLNSVVEVSAGDGFTCARLADGSVRCWGGSGSGQLGLGKANLQRVTIPTTVQGTGSVTDIALGYDHACAVISDQTVKCWGKNDYGQLGDGTIADSFEPVTVVGLNSVTSVSLGKNFSCARNSSGTVKCWGGNGSGTLGDGTLTQSLTPTFVSGISSATQIGSGEVHACALLADKTARCWGHNGSGQLGDGTGTLRSSPVEVSGLTNITQIALGYRQTCALLSDGTVQCWGLNTYGQLGDGTMTYRTSPVAVSGLTSVTSIALGREHTCAIVSGGAAKCWGRNNYGQIGDGTTSDRYTATDVSGLTNATSIALGQSSSCALKSNRTVECWGGNVWGQLGDGTYTSNQVPNLVSGLGAITKISAGGGTHNTTATFLCALREDQSVKCWGDASDGKLGLGVEMARGPYTPAYVD